MLNVLPAHLSFSAVPQMPPHKPRRGTQRGRAVLCELANKVSARSVSDTSIPLPESVLTLPTPFSFEALSSGKVHLPWVCLP